ncbi:MAG: hypothetical protein QMB94_08700 [Phycisphaerales bacterium]
MTDEGPTSPAAAESMMPAGSIIASVNLRRVLELARQGGPAGRHALRVMLLLRTIAIPPPVSVLRSGSALH